MESGLGFALRVPSNVKPMKIVSGDRVLSVERSAHELKTKRRGSCQSQMSQVLKKTFELAGRHCWVFSVRGFPTDIDARGTAYGVGRRSETIRPRGRSGPHPLRRHEYWRLQSNAIGCEMPDVLRAIAVMSGAAPGSACKSHDIAA